MTIKLEKLNETEFEEYFDNKIQRYAKALHTNNIMNEELAEKKAKEQMNRFLPKGFNTQKHFFRKLVDNKIVVGFVWIHLNEEKNSVYLYDILVHQNLRGEGYGRAAMNKLEEWIKEFNIENFDLHVFGNNQKATKLYESLGFETTNVYMRKILDKS